MRRCGGIGRRSRLKICRVHARAGSSPASGISRVDSGFISFDMRFGSIFCLSDSLYILVTIQAALLSMRYSGSISLDTVSLSMYNIRDN